MTSMSNICVVLGVVLSCIHFYTARVMFAVSLYKPVFFMHSQKRLSHGCAHLHVAASGSSEGFHWQ